MAAGNELRSDLRPRDYAAIFRAPGLCPVVLMGSGLGSVPMGDITRAANDSVQTVVPAKLQIETLAVPLVDVEKTWNENTGKSRVVFVLN